MIIAFWLSSEVRFAGISELDRLTNRLSWFLLEPGVAFKLICDVENLIYSSDPNDTSALSAGEFSLSPGVACSLDGLGLISELDQMLTL